ncbi:ATP/ADP translocase [Encephalitozoon hellem ATCC 50504]|uniref:ADP,ATP carrier protein n=1 Tax=Encephalitozoon hellem TaxID=27973 RepID=A0A9Q9F8S8_ENCHE|nr:ATP/ADP translocase [Encephalitozoon hellem ATCC 50504]AFM98830.1 ATP/ADP translocase [Encephalitozoon hellem ATCC 50504]UTX43808.1 vacuolar membrane proton pump [Encephalitozoon hellem]|eukprot:XP_003887811.1 ATP/ADP translocase [Encephalitozoon hellem ATCC 50504]
MNEVETSNRDLSNADIPTEDQIEEEANSRRGIFRYFRVARAEYTKFAILGLMFGIIGFIYSFMRILKDMFVMVRQEPTTILFIKIFYILPVSMALVFLIQYMLGTKTVSRIFSIFCGGFASLFFVCGIVFLIEEQVSPSKFLFRDMFIDGKMSTRGLNVFKSMLLTLNEPLATIVFISAEMWGSLVLSYLFLSFLNESCTIKQFSRFIPPLIIITNVSLFLSATVAGAFFKLREKLAFQQNQFLLSGIFISQGLLVVSVIFLKIYLERVVMKRPLFIVSSGSRRKKAKANVSFSEGLEIMSQSKLLLAMSLIVLFFNISYNMIESTFKVGVKVAAEYYNEEKGKYSGKFNRIDQYLTSVVVICLNLSPFSSYVETRGFLLVGIITPVVTLLAITLFLGSALYNTSMEESGIGIVNGLFPSGKPLYMLENYSGIIFMSLLKITKYSAFDICKEKLGMRINPTYRARFKSVYDGIFGKLGKSIGSIYGLLMFEALDTEDLRKATPITAGIIFIFVVMWIKAIIYLSKSYDSAVQHNRDVDIDMTDKGKKSLEVSEQPKVVD